MGIDGIVSRGVSAGCSPIRETHRRAGFAKPNEHRLRCRPADRAGANSPAPCDSFDPVATGGTRRALSDPTGHSSETATD